MIIVTPVVSISIFRYSYKNHEIVKYFITFLNVIIRSRWSCGDTCILLQILRKVTRFRTLLTITYFVWLSVKIITRRIIEFIWSKRTNLINDTLLDWNEDRVMHNLCKMHNVVTLNLGTLQFLTILVRTLTNLFYHLHMCLKTARWVPDRFSSVWSGFTSLAQACLSQILWIIMVSISVYWHCNTPNTARCLILFQQTKYRICYLSQTWHMSWLSLYSRISSWLTSTLWKPISFGCQAAGHSASITKNTYIILTPLNPTFI